MVKSPTALLAEFAWSIRFESLPLSSGAHLKAMVWDDAVAIGEMMHLGLSYDHRVVDGGPDVGLLRAVK